MSSRRDLAQARLAEADEQWRKQCIDFSSKPDTSPLKDKGILITGGASGLGAAFAQAFARAGAYVVVLDLNDQAGAALAAESETNGLHIKYVHCDITSYAEQLAAFKTAIEFPPSKTLSHVLANAGVRGDIFPFPSDDGNHEEEDPPEPKLLQIEVSLKGLYYTTYLAAHFMGGKKAAADVDRSILLTGSLLSYRGIRQHVDYCGAKFGARGIFKALRYDLRKECGIRINMLVPTFVRTPLIEESFEAIKERWGFASMEIVVEAVLRLVSDSGIDGRAVCVGAEGPFDVRDDPEGLSGGLTMREYLESGAVPVEGS